MAPVPPSERDRRIMFAMDFRDPVTGRRVRDLDIAAEGLGKSIRPPSGLFVWLDFNPPSPRDIRVTARSSANRFAAFDEVIQVPAHVPNTPAASLTFTRTLTPTGLYEPPEGLTGAAGWLVEDAARAPVAGARVSLGFRHAGTQTFTSAYEAVTDSGGRFVALANDLGDVRPDPAPPDPLRPGIDVGVRGWLEIRRGSETRYSTFLPLRTGRLVRVDEPFVWAMLDALPP